MFFLLFLYFSEIENIKYRRSPVSGLFSFPRTGRSGGRAGIGNAVDNTDTGEWEESMPALNSNEDYNGNFIFFLS
jgi:hypothetical protein